MKKFGQQNWQSTSSAQTGQPFQRSRSSYTPRRTKGIAALELCDNGIFMKLEAPYNKQFMEVFKDSIISKKRMWDNNDKAWYVVKDQFDKLCHILDKFYGETILTNFPSADVEDSAYAKLYLLPGAPLEVVRAAYKALATKHHPDKGGDTNIMTEINVAYKEILGELKNGD